MTGTTIPAVISARATVDPELTAVDDGRERVSFAEFDRRVEAAAARLRVLGLRPGGFVGVCVERSASMVVLLLAVLRIGGAYVALDPSHPPARLRWVLEDVGPRFVVASDPMVPTVDLGVVPVHPLGVVTDGPATGEGRDDADGSGSPPSDTSCEPTPRAFITYTSGTSGSPKGVVHGHAAAVRLVDVLTRYLELGPGCRFLYFYPLTWETHILEIYAVLAAGGTVVIPPVEIDTTGPDLVPFLRDARVTHAMVPPALLAELVERPALPDLGVLAYIGEPCRPEAAQRWGRGRRLVNLYGPTEVTVVATASDRCDPGQAPPIGVPLPGRRVYLLDPHGEPVPDGEPGEIHVGGDGIAVGYWRQPEATAKAFVHDPFASRPDARMYRTGDLARHRLDGQLEFLGRADGQLSLRGQRIERGEVEAILLRHPGVTTGAVVVQGEEAGARLVAFVVAAPEVVLELVAASAAELPPIMVPSRIVALDRLPLNQHGKVDLAALARRPLPAPDPVPLPQDSTRPHGGAEPADATAAALAAIWRQVLGAPVDPGTGFRSAGGTSLQAVRALTLIRERFGTGLSVRDLLGASTLADVARTVERDAAGTVPPLPVLERTAVPANYRATAAQRRLWTLSQMRPVAAAAYNEVWAMRVAGRLDVVALRAALQDLVDRHEALRSTFRLTGSTLWVDVAPSAPVELETVCAPDPEAHAASWAARSFDLARAPLLRALLVNVGSQVHHLVLATHHAVADGLSLDVLDADLDHCYMARARGIRPKPLPADRIRSRDHAAWREAVAEHPATTASRARWAEVLAGAPTDLDLDPGGSRPRLFNYAGGRLRRSTGPQLRRDIELLARRAGSSPYAVCLLAFAVVLARRTGRRDLVIGSPYAGRPGPADEEAVGFFTNTVAMRVDLGGDSLVPVRALTALEGLVQDALQDQYVDFDDVVRMTGARAGRSGQPLVQTVLAYQGPYRPRTGLGDLHVTSLWLESNLVKADLTVEVNEVGDDLVVVLPYSTDVVSAADAGEILAHFLDVLAELTAAPREPLLLHHPSTRDTAVAASTGRDN